MPEFDPQDCTDNPESYGTTAAHADDFTIHGDPAPLFEALAEAQGKFAPISKTLTAHVNMTKGGSYKFKYAPLDELIRATAPALSAHGLTLMQPVSRAPEGFTVRTILAHKSGAYIQTIARGIAPETIQDWGKAITYIRRYSYSILGVAPEEDDDGNRADGNQAQIERRPAAPTKAPQKPAPAPKAPEPAPAAKAQPAPAQPEQPPPPVVPPTPKTPPATPNEPPITPETEKAIQELLRLTDKSGRPRFTASAARQKILAVVGRETRVQAPDGTWETTMTEAEGQRLVEALKVS